MTKRIGASSKESIDPAVLQQLNAGSMESATLSEALAVDFSVLMAHAVSEMSRDGITQLQQAHALGITKRMELAANVLVNHLGDQAFDAFCNHASDTVRGWAAYIVGLNPNLPLEEKLLMIQPLADDAHFGVREWAWLALRPAIAQDIKQSIALFMPWIANPSENIRRFAIESTRPRGVWCKHIPALKTCPAIGETLLDGVMADASRYVQNSCANWLNDAGKSDVEWVKRYCEKWRAESSSEAVTYISRRALRNVSADTDYKSVTPT